jgi:sulfur-carrier protein
VVLIRLTANLARHTDASEAQVSGTCVREALADLFAVRPRLRSYLLDDQGGLRKHMSCFVDGVQVHDREHLADPVQSDSIIDVIQALSGG